jgi:hypothetical protein
MSLWTSSVIALLLLQPLQSHVQEVNNDSKPAVIEEPAGTAGELPPRLPFTHKDFEMTQAYSDVFKILSDQNRCSSFYGGPRKATTVLNDFVPLVKSHRLLKELSFQMTGMPRTIYNPVVKVSYRLFDRSLVNSDGSFYQRRLDSLRRFPSDVGSFPPGTRAARALILLHELGHLIQDENGSWLLPDDGSDGARSHHNTLLIQRVCRPQLDALQ